MYTEDSTVEGKWGFMNRMILRAENLIVNPIQGNTGIQVKSLSWLDPQGSKITLIQIWPLDL